MLVPLSSPHAYRSDLGLYPGRESFGAQDDFWVLLAHVLERMVERAPEERTDYAIHVGRELAKSLAEAESSGDPVPEWTPKLYDLLDAFCAVGSPDGTDGLFEACLRVAADIEDAGAFYLSYSVLGHLRLAVPSATRRFHGWAMTNQARIARQLGELDAAAELYASADELALSTGNPDLRARVAHGMGGLTLMRGNLPSARKHYERSLAAAREAASEELISDAHRGLLVVSAKAGAFDDAIKHGWEAFERASNDPAAQAELLANIAAVCDDSGHYDASFAAYILAALWGRVLRVRLPSLGGAALAAAHLRNREQLQVLTQRIERELSAGAPPYESAQVLLDLAIAHEIARDATASGFAARARALGVSHQFFEIVHAAREIADRMKMRVRARRRSRVELTQASTSVLSSISALADEIGAYAALAGVSEE